MGVVGSRAGLPAELVSGLSVKKDHQSSGVLPGPVTAVTAASLFTACF